MPKAVAKKKVLVAPVVLPVAPVTPPPPDPAPVTVVPAVNLPIMYDHLEIDEFSVVSSKGPLDVEWAMTAMGWETEPQYIKRCMEEKPGTKPEQWMFGDGVMHKDGSGRIQPVHCRNTAGEKVICWHNANNRPFDEAWCENLIHTILYGQWAGPYTFPGETVNGETIRISKYGRVLSGQHSMTALILAWERLLKARKNGMDTPTYPKYPMWKDKDAPFIETIVVRGMSEDPRILMTVDYVKPRSVADVFYTSALFKDAASVERKELCRLLAQATDMLWTRTVTKGYRTHPEIVAFLERHKTLLKCVEHLYNENSVAGGRRIARLGLTPGHCAALMYIQGSSGPKTEGDFYRNESPPSEKNLDWSLWDKAADFWTLLGAGKEFSLVRDALARLDSSLPTNPLNQGLGGKPQEKLAILALAWERWRDHADAGPVFYDDDFKQGGDLALDYVDYDAKGKKLPPGEVMLTNVADFYGIDCPGETSKTGDKEPKPEPLPPSAEEIERETEKIRQENATKPRKK